MGSKVTNFIFILSGLVVILTFLGLLLPLHQLSFFTLGGVFKVFNMKTYALTVDTDKKSNDFCNTVEKMKIYLSDKKKVSENKDDKGNFCQGIEGSRDLQDIQQRFCAPAMKYIFPNACTGLSYAYLTGMILILMCACNVVLVLTSVFLYYQYSQKPRPRTRRYAVGLNAVGLLLLMLALCVYAGLTLVQLDDMKPKFAGLIGAIALAPNSGWGVSKGYWVLSGTLGLQLITVILSNFVKSSSELDEDEYREWKEQQQAYGEQYYGEQAKFAGQEGYQATGYSDYGAAGYGQASASSGGWMQPQSVQGWAQPEWQPAQGSQPLQPAWGPGSGQP